MARKEIFDVHVDPPRSRSTQSDLHAPVHRHDAKKHAAAAEIRVPLEAWADATRENRRDDVLARHASDVLVYDVLAPMKYEGAEAYRRSWDDWQPDTRGEGRFDLEDVSVTTEADVAFATCFIRCGGALPDGRTFEDLVRATFCLQTVAGVWTVVHQHISKPLQVSGA